MNNINYTEASLQELMPLLGDLEDACVGNKKSHIILACIVLAFMMQDPDMSSERLITGVREVTELIALHVATPEKVQTH